MTGVPYTRPSVCCISGVSDSNVHNSALLLKNNHNNCCANANPRLWKAQIFAKQLYPMWQHSNRIIQWGFAARWIKSLWKRRGRERAFQVKNKKRWNADFWWRAFGSRQLLHYAPRRHKHAATVSVTKGFWWGRLASRLKSKYLSFLKRKHSWFVSRLNSTTASSCMILTQTWPLTWTEGGKERVYSTSVTHSTLWTLGEKLTSMQHRDDC